MTTINITREDVLTVRPKLTADQVAEVLSMADIEQDKIKKDAIRGIATWLFPQYQRAIK
jgi:hypothetical protein